MKKVTRRAALMLVAMGVGTGGGLAGAQAQDNARRIDGGRDLTVELAKPGASAAHRPGRRAVHVSVMPVGPSSIAIGTPLGLRMVSTADGFGDLYVLSASGRTQVWLENVPLRAGEPIAYPRRGLIVRAAPPAGDETVIFVASRDRIEGFAGPGPLTAPLELEYTHESLRAAIQQRFRDIPRERWAFAEIQIRVHD